LVAGYWLFIALAYAMGGHEPHTVESFITMGLIVASTADVLKDHHRTPADSWSGRASLLAGYGGQEVRA
jgi:hypothetical protein